MKGLVWDALHDLPERRTDRVIQIIRSVPHDGGRRLDLPAPHRLACHTDTGRRLFREGGPFAALRLVGSLIRTKGVVIGTYRPASA